MSWIWLNKKEYPQYQLNFSNGNSIPEESKRKYNYCVADFQKTFSFSKKVERVTVNVSADCTFHLFVNGKYEGFGPAMPGGDFLCRQPAPKHYYNTYEINCNCMEIKFEALVKLLAYKQCEYSRNHGGFYLFGTVFFEDGTKQTIETDESWLSRMKSAYRYYDLFDSREIENSFTQSSLTEDIWNVFPSEIPNLHFENLLDNTYSVNPGEEKEFEIELDKIYGAYPVLESNGKCEIIFKSCELPGQVTEDEKIIFGKEGVYHSFSMHSVGYVYLIIKNTHDRKVSINLKLNASYYPVTEEGSFICSDGELNKVYDVCKHTLKICRQSIHLDSVKHQEMLACTGDYYIDALMTLYLFGDMRLCQFDIVRTGDWIEKNCGRIMHTTYSLIWVQMLRDVYMFTGNKELLERCKKALDLLLLRMRSYKGDSGLIEYPPDFMFVDWTVIDGYSMHRPPKSLGQTVLNAFYYKALTDAEYIYSVINEGKKSDECIAEAEKFKEAFNRDFFRVEKDMYISGKTDDYGGFERHIPPNSSKIYFTKYPNILAVLYGLCDEEKGKDIIERIVCDKQMHDIQPYFMHFLICAVRKTGLFSKYGMELLSRWKSIVKECDKGLQEGWIPPEEGYSFDHSHSWGGTAAYQLPSVISGMKILEPGMRKLSFSPELWGLDFADITIPTRWGNICLKIKKGEKAQITCPEEIEII